MKNLIRRILHFLFSPEHERFVLVVLPLLAIVLASAVLFPQLAGIAGYISSAPSAGTAQASMSPQTVNASSRAGQVRQTAAPVSAAEVSRQSAPGAAGAEPEKAFLTASPVGSDLYIFVRSESGAPVTGTAFTLGVANMYGQSAYYETQADGSAYLSGLEAGAYTVSFADAKGYAPGAPVTVQISETVAFTPIADIMDIVPVRDSSELLDEIKTATFLAPEEVMPQDISIIIDSGDAAETGAWQDAPSIAALQAPAAHPSGLPAAYSADANPFAALELNAAPDAIPFTSPEMNAAADAAPFAALDMSALDAVSFSAPDTGFAADAGPFTSLEINTSADAGLFAGSGADSSAWTDYPELEAFSAAQAPAPGSGDGSAQPAAFAVPEYPDEPLVLSFGNSSDYNSADSFGDNSGDSFISSGIQYAANEFAAGGQAAGNSFETVITAGNQPSGAPAAEYGDAQGEFGSLVILGGETAEAGTEAQDGAPAAAAAQDGAQPGAQPAEQAPAQAGNREGSEKGWAQINGKTYYLDGTGHCITGLVIIDNRMHYFDANGVKAKALGADVSFYNGNVDWRAVKNAGIDFVIVRVGGRGWSTGALYSDSCFYNYLHGAKSAGLDVGIYFYSTAVNIVEAVEEASLAVSMLKGTDLEYPVYIDMEYSGDYPAGRADLLGAAQRVSIAEAFCRTIETAGYSAGIYASQSFFKEALNTEALSRYSIWIASYTENNALPRFSSRYDMWQFTDRGRITGINGCVDLDVVPG